MFRKSFELFTICSENRLNLTNKISSDPSPQSWQCRLTMVSLKPKSDKLWTYSRFSDSKQTSYKQELRKSLSQETANKNEEFKTKTSMMSNLFLIRKRFQMYRLNRGSPSMQ